MSLNLVAAVSDRQSQILKMFRRSESATSAPESVLGWRGASPLQAYALPHLTFLQRYDPLTPLGEKGRG